MGRKGPTIHHNDLDTFPSYRATPAPDVDYPESYHREMGGRGPERLYWLVVPVWVTYAWVELSLDGSPILVEGPIGVDSS